MTRFTPEDFERFEYTSFSLDQHTGTIRCGYRLVGPVSTIKFTEQFVLGAVEGGDWAGPRRETMRRVAELLWLAAGVSYYKAAAPAVVSVPVPLSEAQQVWLEALYREGLGEFAFDNDIDLSARPYFEFAAGSVPAPLSGLGLPRRSLVPVGGGKDSCVSIDLLQQTGDDLILFNVGNHRAARDIAAACGLRMVTAERVLDPQLIALNAEGALNGHIPVTAIVSLVAVAQALTTGADRVVFSNERSANTPNFIRHGLPVNHQYSKGLTAEGRFRAALAEITPDISYFSLLRPLSELQIATLFARSDHFLPVFTSCNAAFRLDTARRVERWCGHCPKCRFVFLALAPFIDRDRLVTIFGADLLDDDAQLPGYRELLGLAGHKPFECVGEIEECQVALRLVIESGHWEESVVVAALARELEQAGLEASDSLVEAVFVPSTEHHLPPDVADALHAALSPAGALGGAL